MYLILDACTIINLLQIDLICEDEECRLEYDYLSRIVNTNFKIKVIEKVFQEVQNNYSANLQYRYQKKSLEKYINTDLKVIISTGIDTEVFQSLLDFIKTSTNYIKDNGELHSTAYALYLSRYENSNNYLMLQTHFVTDDDGAYNDFVNFFYQNQLGNIFSTLDLLMLLHLKNIFTFQHVIKFALDLKKQYVTTLNASLERIENLQKKSLPTKIIATLSSLHFSINQLDLDKIKAIMLNRNYQIIKRQDSNLDSLLTSLITSDFKKVALIDEKINSLKKLYWSSEKL